MSPPTIAQPTRLPREKVRPRFYLGMALFMSAIVFIGFAPTYYLKAYTGSGALSPLVHLHGIVFTSWMLVFCVQALLVARSRTHLHRRLGIATVALAVVILVVGTATGIAAARRGHDPTGAGDPLAFLSVPMGDMVFFALLFGMAFHYRRNVEVHKRLMLLTTLNLLTAAIGRLPLIGESPLFVASSYAGILLIGPLYDCLWLGKVYPLYWAGTAALFLSVLGRFQVGKTQAWHTFARWLVE